MAERITVTLARKDFERLYAIFVEWWEMSLAVPPEDVEIRDKLRAALDSEDSDV